MITLELVGGPADGARYESERPSEGRAIRVSTPVQSETEIEGVLVKYLSQRDVYYFYTGHQNAAGDHLFQLRNCPFP